MPCLFRLLSILILFTAGVVGMQFQQAAEPEIVSLTCSDGLEMGYHPTVQFAWQTQRASAVRVESGHLDAQGTFHPGAWYVNDDLPPQGSGNFFMKLGNDAVQVCITAPESAAGPVCEACVGHPVYDP